MEELSLHLIDLIENSISAKASLIKILIEVSKSNDLIKIVIEDNGEGMNEEEIEKAKDPFFTTKKNKKVGLGIPIFAQIVESCGGRFEIVSQKGKGTKVNAEMKLSHIDRPPLGDLASTLFTSIIGHPDVDFLIKIKTDEGIVEINTAEIKEFLGESSFNHPEVIIFLRENIDREIKGILKGGI